MCNNSYFHQENFSFDIGFRSIFKDRVYLLLLLQVSLLGYCWGVWSCLDPLSLIEELQRYSVIISQKSFLKKKNLLMLCLVKMSASLHSTSKNANW